MGLGLRSRAWCVLGALAVLVAACGGSGSSAVTGPGGSASTTVAGGPQPGSSPTTGGEAPTGATPVPSVEGSSPGTGGTGGPTTTTPSDAVIGVGSTGVGGVAAALLRPGRGDRVVLEVRAQPGMAPEPATIDHLVRVLQDASGKPVAVDGVDGLAGGARDWTAREIVERAASAAQVESGRRQVVLRLLFLQGTYGGDTGVLGVAVAGDVAAVFSDQVDASAGVLVSPTVVEDAVATHEVGHLLGLVDLVLRAGRGDPAHPGHSRNRRSVMYWQVDSGLVTQLLDGGIPTDFDADDRAELAQIRAG